MHFLYDDETPSVTSDSLLHIRTMRSGPHWPADAIIIGDVQKEITDAGFVFEHGASGLNH
jgi:hypothetical protein